MREFRCRISCLADFSFSYTTVISKKVCYVHFNINLVYNRCDFICCYGSNININSINMKGTRTKNSKVNRPNIED